MTKAVLIVLCVVFSLRTASAQAQPCQLQVSAAPEVRGFRLEMAFRDAATRSSSWVSMMPADEFGERSASIGRNPTEPELKGIEAITLGFVDDRLSDLSFHYQPTDLFRTGEEFADSIQQALQLPATGWQPTPPVSLWQGRILRCAGFEVEAGLTNYGQPVLVFRATDLRATAARRKADDRKRRLKTFKP